MPHTPPAPPALPTPRSSRALAAVAGVAIALGVGTLRATASEPPAPAPASTASPDPLAGPKVSIQRARTILVERDMSGTVKRLDVAPEEAALELVKIDADSRKKIDAILLSRANIIDEFVRENLFLIAQIHSANQSGDRAEVVKLLQEARPKLEPLAARGKLLDEFKTALPPEQYQRVEAAVRDYRAALFDDFRAEKKEGPERRTLAAFAGREVVLELGQQIKRSYERQFTAKAAQFDKLLAQLELKPEKEAKIRNMVTEHAQKYRGNPTPEQNRTLYFQILASLEPDKQRELIRLTRTMRE